MAGTHDFKHMEFNRATEQGEMVREAEIHGWCVCGEWFMVAEHRHLRTVSDAFIEHLAGLPKPKKPIVNFQPPAPSNRS